MDCIWQSDVSEGFLQKVIDDDDVAKKTKISMVQMHIISSWNDIISSQNCLLNEIKESFVMQIGEAQYHQKTFCLINLLPNLFFHQISHMEMRMRVMMME